MTTRRLLPLAALLAAVALIGAGCGSGSDQPSAADAGAAYQPIRAELRGLGASIGTEIGNAGRETDVQLADAFDKLDARGRAAVQRLQGLDVPSSLDDELQALHDAVEQGTQDLADIARAAQAHDAAAARRAAEALVADSQTIGDARRAFERALDQAAK